MEQSYVTMEVHEEFARRQDEENKRQNRRISLLEDNMRQINALTVSVEKMAVNMGNMLEEQKRQGERLEALEREPAEAHRQMKMAAVTAVISAVAGAIAGALLVLL